MRIYHPKSEAEALFKDATGGALQNALRKCGFAPSPDQIISEWDTLVEWWYECRTSRWLSNKTGWNCTNQSPSQNGGASD